MRSVSYSSRREHSINNPRRQSGDPQDSPYHLSASRRDALSVCLPLGARLATNVEQTPDGSLGTHHNPHPPLSVPEGRSFLKDNINNKNNMLDSMLSKLSVLFFLRQPFFVLKTTKTTKTTCLTVCCLSCLCCFFLRQPFFVLKTTKTTKTTGIMIYEL